MDRGQPPPYRPVPVEAAKSISDQFAKNWVVIIAGDVAHNRMHTVTYGRSAAEKVTAAMIGEFCAAKVGAKLDESEVFEDFRAVPAAEARAELEEALRRIAKLEAENVRLREDVEIVQKQRAAVESENAKLHDALKFFRRLPEERGVILSSADCDEVEIAIARSCGRFFVDDEGTGIGLGYVMRPKEWLERVRVATQEEHG